MDLGRIFGIDFLNGPVSSRIVGLRLVVDWNKMILGSVSGYWILVFERIFTVICLGLVSCNDGIV